MSHFAKVLNGKVTQVIVADSEFFQTFVDSSPGEWVQCSYNTRGGIHYSPTTGQPDGNQQIGFNYPGVGYSWDGTGFAAPQPFPSWMLNKSTYQWEPPVAMPSDGKPYAWFEPNQEWIEVSSSTSP